MRHAFGIAVLVLVSVAGEAGEVSSEPIEPTLEWIRDCLIGPGVPPRYVRIEEVPGQPGRRLLFWTRTPRISQTVLVGVSGDLVSVQSSGLAELQVDHPRLVEALLYLMDRNFAMAGARFARQESDGQIVIRTDIRSPRGISESELMNAIESLLLLADREAPKLREMLDEAVGG